MSVRLAQVVELLRSSDDDHRFVGLLLAPRFLALDAELVDSADDAQATASSGRRSGGGSSSAAEIMRILYRAMGFDFLRRLLNTDDDEGAYQDAALTVTLSFMRDEAFRHELELGSLCEPATRIVEAKATKSGTRMLALQLLLWMARECSVTVAQMTRERASRIVAGAVRALQSLTRAQGEHKQQQQQQQEQEQEQGVGGPQSPPAEQASGADDDEAGLAHVRVALSVFFDVQRDAALHAGALLECAERLALAPLTGDTLAMISNILMALPVADVTRAMQPPSKKLESRLRGTLAPWIEQLRVRLLPLLARGAEKDDGKHAVCITSRLTECAGLGYLLGPEWKDAQYLVFVLQMARVELRMSADWFFSEIASEEVAAAASSDREAVFASVCALLETLLTASIPVDESDEDAEWNMLPRETQAQAGEIVLEMLQSIVGLLQRAAGGIDAARSLVVRAALRCISCWLGLDEKACARDDVIALVPLFAAVTRREAGDAADDLLVLLLPALQHMFLWPAARDALVKHGMLDRLLAWLSARTVACLDAAGVRVDRARPLSDADVLGAVHRTSPHAAAAVGDDSASSARDDEQAELAGSALGEPQRVDTRRDERGGPAHELSQAMRGARVLTRDALDQLALAWSVLSTAVLLDARCAGALAPYAEDMAAWLPTLAANVDVLRNLSRELIVRTWGAASVVLLAALWQKALPAATQQSFVVVARTAVMLYVVSAARWALELDSMWDEIAETAVLAMQGLVQVLPSSSVFQTALLNSGAMRVLWQLYKRSREDRNAPGELAETLKRLLVVCWSVHPGDMLRTAPASAEDAAELQRFVVEHAPKQLDRARQASA